MAEYSPLGAEASDEDDDELENSTSSTRKKRASGLGASLLGREVAKSDKAERPMPKSFGEALDMILGNKKTEKEELAEKARTIPWDSNEGVAQTIDKEVAPEESPAGEVPRSQELPPNELSGGETIIDLGHPVEAVDSTTEEEPSEEVANEAKTNRGEEGQPDETAENEAEDTAEQEPLAEVDNTAEDEPDEDIATSTPVSQPSAGSTSSATPGSSGRSGSGGGSSGGGAGSSTTGSAGPSSSSSSSVPTPTPTPTPSTSGGGSMGSGPPIPPGTVHNAMPVGPSSQNIITLPVPDIEAQWRAQRRGFRRGFIGGLLIGGGIEHIRHKRRERRMERSHEAELSSKDKLLDQEKERQQIENDKRSNQEYWEAKKRQREDAQTENIDKQSRSPETSQVSPVEKVAENQNEAKYDRGEWDKPEEAHLVAPVFVPSYQEKKMSSEKTTEMEEATDTPNEHHFERSAWHNIEVDQRGGAVQETSINYGKEYQAERAKERGLHTNPRDVPTSAGEIALVSHALHGQSKQNHLDRVKKTAGLPKDSKTSDLEQANANGLTQTLKKVAGPPTTAVGTLVWLLILVCMVFIAMFFLL